MTETQWDGDAYQARIDALAAEGGDMHGEADFVARLSPLSVLDAGCGTGRVAIELARRGVWVVGADHDPSMLDTAQRLAPDLEWVRADLADLDLGRAFDVVLMAGNVPLFTPAGTTAAVISGCARHLAPDGYLVAGFQLGRGYHVDQYDKEAAAAGLTLVARYATWDLDPFHEGADYAVSVHQPGSSVEADGRPGGEVAPELDVDADAPSARHADARQEQRAPICSWCGVTTLPGTAVGIDAAFACDNADCPAYGEPLD